MSYKSIFPNLTRLLKLIGFHLKKDQLVSGLEKTLKFLPLVHDQFYLVGLRHIIWRILLFQVMIIRSHLPFDVVSAPSPSSSPSFGP